MLAYEMSCSTGSPFELRSQVPGGVLYDRSDVGGAMTMRISIGACRRALSIMSWTEVGGIRLTLEGEERVITQVVAREGHWYSGEDRLDPPATGGVDRAGASDH